MTEPAESGAETEGADAPEAAPVVSPRPLGPKLLIAGLVVLAVVAVLQTVRLSSRGNALDGRTEQLDARETEAADRQAIALTAGALAEALLSYDYNDLDGSLAAVEAHIGGPFAEVYPEIFRTVQTPVITQLQAVATASVDDIYVTDIDGDTAKAIVLVDLSVQSTAGLRTLTGTYLQMDLVRREGEWLVESIPLRISSSEESITGAPELVDPTATTAPP